MNDCPNGEMRDLLPDLLHERLDAASSARVEAHVAGCADCRAELALLAQLRGTLRRAPAVDVASIVGAIPAYRAPVRQRWGGWRAAAAIAAITVGGTSVAIARHQPAGTAPAVVAIGGQASGGAPSVATPVDSPAAAPAVQVAQGVPARELAVAGTVADLSDSELAALLEDIESLDVLPAAGGDVEGHPLAPAPSGSQGES